MKIFSMLRLKKPSDFGIFREIASYILKNEENPLVGFSEILGEARKLVFTKKFSNKRKKSP